MAENRTQTRNKSKNNVIGGQWLPNLLTWGGVLLMITGGVFAYPTLQGYLAPPDAASLEFSVTAAPPTAAVALQPPPTATAPAPIILPETELITPETPATPEATAATPPTPTPPPPPTATPDPASLLPSRLVIPAIDLDTPVLEVGWETQEINGQTVSSWIVPDSFATGWHKTSALPGQVGNTVLNGHHNIQGEVFRDLEDLAPGDEIAIYTGDTVRYYTVTERHILAEKGQPIDVRIQNAQWIMPTEDERLTLVTCWPYTNNTHRLVIVGTPFEQPPTPTPMQQ